MALYTTLASLSQTAASNAADGATDAPSTIDQQMNLLASFIAQVRDGNNTAPGNTGRLLRTTIYTLISGVQNISVDGGAPTTTGATTFTPLATTTAIVAEAIGGGGGGGGTSATGASQAAAAGGGGGAVYGRGRFTSAFSGLTITAGTAGLAGAVNSGGGNGGSSSLGGLLVCPGGTGGQVGVAVTPPTFSASIVGSLALPTGANLLSTLGGFSGNAFALSTGQLLSGAGGASVFGAGGQPRLNVTAVGLPGNGYGAGGSGASGGSSVAGQAGGAGAPGIVIIYEYT